MRKRETTGFSRWSFILHPIYSAEGGNQARLVKSTRSSGPSKVEQEWGTLDKAVKALSKAPKAQAQSALSETQALSRVFSRRQTGDGRRPSALPFELVSYIRILGDVSGRALMASVFCEQVGGRTGDGRERPRRTGADR